jgi:hypothetical protein
MATVSSPDRSRSCCRPFTGWRYAPGNPEADPGFDVLAGLRQKPYSYRICGLAGRTRAPLGAP